MEFERRREKDAVVLAVRGALDVSTTPLLRAELTTLQRAGERQVIIDLREVTAADRAAIGALVVESYSYRRAGAELALRSPSRALRRVLDLTGVEAVLRVED